MYPTFKVLIPVRIYSSASNLAIKSLPLELLLFNSSNSLLNPSFIKYPYFITIGGFSYIEYSSKTYNSLNVSISLKLIAFNIFFISGNTFSEFFN